MGTSQKHNNKHGSPFEKRKLLSFPVKRDAIFDATVSGHFNCAKI